MSNWNPDKPLDSFPARWHALVREAEPGMVVLLVSAMDRATVLRAQKSWRNFMASMRRHPIHPTAVTATRHTFRTMVRQAEFDGLWELWIRIGHTMPVVQLRRL